MSSRDGFFPDPSRGYRLKTTACLNGTLERMVLPNGAGAAPGGDGDLLYVLQADGAGNWDSKARRCKDVRTFSPPRAVLLDLSGYDGTLVTDAMLLGSPLVDRTAYNTDVLYITGQEVGCSSGPGRTLLGPSLGAMGYPRGANAGPAGTRFVLDGIPVDWLSD